jgi:hypothetical protein
MGSRYWESQTCYDGFSDGSHTRDVSSQTINSLVVEADISAKLLSKMKEFLLILLQNSKGKEKVKVVFLMNTLDP